MNGHHTSKHTALLSAVRHLSKKPFVRNIVTASSGTAGAQGIAIAFAPLITRFYGPEAFGVQGVFMSLAGCLASVAALTYPIAIVLPNNNTDARGLAELSVYIGIGIALIVTLLLWWSGAQLLALINANAISDYMYLLPMFMMFSVCSAVLGQWLVREKQFGVTAKVAVCHSLVVNGAKAAIGIVYPSATILITVHTLGHLLLAALQGCGLRNRSSLFTNIGSPLRLRELANRYRDFPLMRAPQVLLNSISHGLPVIMLAGFFGPAAAGFYALANTVLALPAALLGASITQVFYPTVNDAYQHGENIRPLIMKVTAGMALIGIAPFLLVILFGPILFELVFGQEWRTAGEYAQWLSAWLFFGYINKPSIAAIPVLGLQAGLLVYELFSTASKVLALITGYWLFDSAMLAIALFSASGALAYLCLIVWVIKSAKVKDAA